MDKTHYIPLIFNIHVGDGIFIDLTDSDQIVYCGYANAGAFSRTRAEEIAARYDNLNPRIKATIIPA